MYKSKKVLILLAVLIFSTGSLFAQSSANVAVTLSVKKALSVAYETGNLDFQELILVGDLGSVTRTPDNGAKFKVSGHNSGNVIMTFANSNLTATGSTTPLIFEPVVHSNTVTTYPGATPVTSGVGKALPTTGELFLWVGGSVLYDGADQGDYTGTFTVSVAY